MQTRWITHRLIRRQGRDTNVVAGLHAAVAANLGDRGTACARVSSTHRVVQSVRGSGAFSDSREGTAEGGAPVADASSSSQVGKTPRKEGKDHE